MSDLDEGDVFHLEQLDGPPDLRCPVRVEVSDEDSTIRLRCTRTVHADDAHTVVAVRNGLTAVIAWTHGDPEGVLPPH